MLKDDGFFIFENHYLPSIIGKLQYDTIYHEHLRSLSLSAVSKLFEFYNFTLIDAKEASRYGGNIRVLVRKGKNHNSNKSIKEFLEREKNLGLFEQATYENFRNQAIKSKLELLSLLINLKNKGKKVIGYSLPARAITLINYVGIDQDLLPYIVEQPGSLKLDKYVPGTRIPIRNNICIEEEKPDYMVIFAWHLTEEIIKHMRERGFTGKFIIPLPKVEIR